MTNHDFEMGSEGESPKPQINKYQNKSNKNSEAQSKSEQPAVDPGAAAPPHTPKHQHSHSKTPANPAKKSKALLGCLGLFGGIMLIFLVLSFVFLGMSGGDTNPIGQLLGINQAAFVNGLITFVHVIFLLIALLEFIFAVVGIFSASMAKKDDKETKKSGLKKAMISGILLFITLIIWMAAFVYLDGKRINTKDPIPTGFVTEPEETIGLTAPADIIFDASNLPIDKTRYKIIAYNWEFGDGESGTKSVQKHTYKSKGNTGIFDVILTVTKEDKKTGEITETSFGGKVTIADEAISAIFTADPQSGEAPLTVNFDASDSVDPDGEIERYDWDFDEDGIFDDADGAEVEHTFEEKGEYTVALRVTSTEGEYTISEKEIIVKEDALPKAVIEVAGKPETYSTGTEYIFKADESTSPNGKIEKYEWDFNDGTMEEKTKTATHIFEKAGEFTITLKVTDEEGEEAEEKLKIQVSSPQGTPEALINTAPWAAEDSLALEGEAPFKVEFDASASTDSDDNIVDYQWDLDGDQESDSFGARIEHTFNEPGTYSINLKVIDADGNIGEAKTAVKVSEQGITAKLEVDKQSGIVPLTVKFDATGSINPQGQITSYIWDFGDGGSPKTGASSIAHKYTAIGTYTASVTAVSDSNARSTAEVTITVSEVPLQACIGAVFESGKAPLNNSFDPSCSTGTIKSYFWNFGDGSTSTEIKPTHEFTTPGDYQISLEITDYENTVSTKEITVKVTE